MHAAQVRCVLSVLCVAPVKISKGLVHYYYYYFIKWSYK